MRSPTNKRSKTNESGRIKSFLASKRAILLGHTPRVSAWIYSVALVSTVAVAAIVAVATVRYTPTGPTVDGSIVLQSPSYIQLWDRFTATFSGNRIYQIFVIGAVVLLLGAIVSTYLNSGLLPTAALVMGPIFGLFVNRIGTPVPVIDPHEPGLSYAPMTLPDAIAWGLESALFLGIPITILGFTTGTIFRRLIPPRWIVNRLESV